MFQTKRSVVTKIWRKTPIRKYVSFRKVFKFQKHMRYTKYFQLDVFEFMRQAVKNFGVLFFIDLSLLLI